MLTRRQLLQRGAIGSAGIIVSRPSFATAAPAAVGATPRLRRWVEALPVPPVLDGRGGGKSFTIAARESTDWKFHPDLPATRTWGYWSDNPQAGLPYLGPTIVATRRPNDTVETSVTVEWRNELDDAFLPNDPTLFGAVLPGQPAPIVTHLHGGENHPQFDGTPLQWFTKGGAKGPHYITNTFTYYNEQRASMVWYHDHALGNTRTNVYAGLAGAYIIRDDQDTGEAGNPLGLPAGSYEIPLVLQDKTFNADGSMFYPTQGVTELSPAVGAGVLRRRRGRQRQDLAVRRRRAAPLPASDRQRIPVAVLQPPVRRTRTAAGHCRSRRSGRRAGCCARPCR